MAIHKNHQSMLHESLPEMLLVAKYSIKFEKNPEVWGSVGCYGYPAALLLLSIVDSIGSHVLGGKADKRFKILNEKPYFNLNLNPTENSTIRKRYRDFLSHNSVLNYENYLNIGTESDSVITKQGNSYVLNLVPLYNACLIAVQQLLNNPSVLEKSKAIEDINKKH